MIDPELADDPPPVWFWEIYLSFITGLPVSSAKTIREMPIYLRNRYRVVHEIMQSARMHIAGRNKAMGVYDYSQLFA